MAFRMYAQGGISLKKYVIDTVSFLGDKQENQQRAMDSTDACSSKNGGKVVAVRRKQCRVVLQAVCGQVED
jgi:hypothetical protein